MKIETGVMVMKDGKAWGVTYEDGHSTAYGWMDAESAPIHDSQFCKRPEDVTYRGSPYVAELRTGKLVHVERRTEVIVTPNSKVSGAGTASAGMTGYAADGSTKKGQK